MDRVKATIFLLFFSVLFVYAQDVELSALELLGKNIYFDKISVPAEVQSCADCHHPDAGWKAIDSQQNLKTGAIVGATSLFAFRAPQSSAYAAFTPVFTYDQEKGFIGGNQWDGRAHGYKYGNPTSDQAPFPITSPVENGNTEQTVMETIANSDYAYLWEEVYGTPIDLEDYTLVPGFGGAMVRAYPDFDKIGPLLGAYQKSAEVSSFTSKFDYYLKGQTRLNRIEKRGMKIFNAKCASCHTMENDPEAGAPLFTDHAYWNIGVPKNPGFEGLPRLVGPDFVDFGVGQTLRDMSDPNAFSPFSRGWRDQPYAPQVMLDFTDEQLAAFIPEYDGKFRTPTLRNITEKPKVLFVREFMHNGAIKTLLGAIQLHNNRSGKLWDEPEVASNLETELVGDLNLKARDFVYLIAFLNTLKDGYNPNTWWAQESELEENLTAQLINVPEEFAFKLAGPNPFNPTTTLQLDLPDAENVKMIVYNSLGQSVATLVNEVLPAGSHQIDFHANNLASGVYVIAVSTPTTKQIQKVTLLK